MNVIQRPGAVCLAADMPDYIIDTDSTITFEVQFTYSGAYPFTFRQLIRV